MCVQFMKKADRSGDGTLDRNEFKSFIEVCCLIDEAIEAGVPADEPAAQPTAEAPDSQTAAQLAAAAKAAEETDEVAAKLAAAAKAAEDKDEACRTIHGVDWEKVMDDKVQSLDSGVADTERRMKRATGAFRAFDVDGSGSLDTAELIQNKSEIGKTMKLKYTPSDDEIRLVRIAAGRALFCEAVVCVCSS